MRLMINTVVVLCFVGCAPTCKDDQRCERQCPEHSWATCTQEDMCRCESFQDAVYSSAQTIMKDCREPGVSDLVIEEVLIDGEPTEESEFVEVRNRSRELLRLDGVSLHVKRGTSIKKSISIDLGCVPPGGIVLFAASEPHPLIYPSWEINPTYGVRRFSYSNSADFVAELRLFDDLVLDAVLVPRDSVLPGVSVVRDDTDGIVKFVDHRLPSRGRASSPGYCTNGNDISLGCGELEVDCRPPKSGDLVINEVLIDAEPESDEFIEIFNRSEHDIDLAGLNISARVNQVTSQKVQIWDGCLPSGQSVTFFPEPQDVLARDDLLGQLQFELHRFLFPNHKTTLFQLWSEGGNLLDSFFASRRDIEPGVSLNRLPDVTGFRIVKHSQHFDDAQSPGLRARLNHSVEKMD